MRVLARLDGTLADPREPFLRADDLGVLRGDGIFETILVVRGRAREMGPHLDRMANSARLMGVQLPERQAWQRAADAVIGAWPWDDEPEMALKLVCTRGIDEGDGTPTGFALGMQVSENTKRRRADGVTAVTLERGYDPDLRERAPWLLLSAKTLSYAVNMAAMREAADRGVDEVVFTANDGSVLEGPTSTVVLASGGTLSTPPPSSGILPGTTQGALFRAAEQAGWRTRVRPVTTAELFAADGVWLASSVRLLAPLRELDGTELAVDEQLHAELTKLHESLY